MLDKVKKRVLQHPLLWGVFVVLSASFTIQKGLEYPIGKHSETDVISAVQSLQTREDYKQLEKILLSDCDEKTSERCGFLVKSPKGNYEYAVTPTLNEFVPDKAVPKFFANWLDKHHFRVPFSQIPYYLKGDEIITTWHMHCNNEPISSGDSLYGKFLGSNELIIRTRPDNWDCEHPSRYLITPAGEAKFIPDKSVFPRKYTHEQEAEHARLFRIDPEKANDYYQDIVDKDKSK